MPRPVVHVPVPHVKTVPQSEMRRNVKRKGENGIANSNLTETQNKSSVANKFVDMAMENMYCKIIAFALFHLYFAILYFCLQNLFSSCNTSFSLKFCYFCLQKAHLYFLNTFIFVCKTLFSFATLQFSCKYIRHCFDSICVTLFFFRATAGMVPPWDLVPYANCGCTDFYCPRYRSYRTDRTARAL